jgi:hypothetical protein
MDRRTEEINLAALLDGELHDDDQVEALLAEIERNPSLAEEYREQLAIKDVLGGLEPYSAPDFMATRVMGEIAARRKTGASGYWRPAFAWFGGVAALILGFLSSMGLLAPRVMQSGSPLLAESGYQAAPLSATPVSSGMLAQPGLFMEVEYAPSVWEELPMPNGNVDERIEDFLRFASESHLYRRLMSSGACDTTGMASAVLVMDHAGQSRVHFAAQD